MTNKIKLVSWILTGLWILGAISICFFDPMISWSIICVQLIATVASYFYFRTNDK